MKLRKTIVMVLAACLLVGTLAGTAFADPTIDVSYLDVDVEVNGYSTVKGTLLPPRLDSSTIAGYTVVGYRADGSAITLPKMVNFTGWMLTDGGNWGYYKNGMRMENWQKIDGAWYYFMPGTGFMVQRGVAWINDRLYVFDDNGKAVDQQGFYLIPTYFYVWNVYWLQIINFN